MTSGGKDPWARWILERRFGGDAEAAARLMAFLGPVRTRLLDHASLSAGDVVVDVGCGDGFVGFGALERVGPTGSVIFSDISDELLSVAATNATALGVADRCSCVLSAVEDLQLADSVADAVVVRSVLIYVEDKVRAFAELYRVTRPGGRISIFEPINSFSVPMRMPPWLFGYNVGAAAPLAVRVQAVFAGIQPAHEDPMLNFDERDLIALAAEAGFFPVTTEWTATITATDPQPWDVFVNTAWNPKIPTLGEAMAEALSARERDDLTKVMKPVVEAGAGRVWQAHSYLWAVKP